MIKTLFSTSAHNSPDTAYVIKDWPYGRTLRCEKHIWIETRAGFGQRVVYRTTNPKRNNTFNAPKAGTYNPFTIFGADAEGLLVIDGLNHYDKPEKFAYFKALLLDAPNGVDVEQMGRLNAFERVSRKYNGKAWAEWDVANNYGADTLGDIVCTAAFEKIAV